MLWPAPSAVTPSPPASCLYSLHSQPSRCLPVALCSVLIPFPLYLAYLDRPPPATSSLLPSIHPHVSRPFCPPSLPLSPLLLSSPCPASLRPLPLPARPDVGFLFVLNSLAARVLSCLFLLVFSSRPFCPLSAPLLARAHALPPPSPMASTARLPLRLVPRLHSSATSLFALLAPSRASRGTRPACILHLSPRQVELWSRGLAAASPAAPSRSAHRTLPARLPSLHVLPLTPVFRLLLRPPSCKVCDAIACLPPYRPPPLRRFSLLLLGPFRLTPQFAPTLPSIVPHRLSQMTPSLSTTPAPPPGISRLLVPATRTFLCPLPSCALRLARPPNRHDLPQLPAPILAPSSAFPAFSTPPLVHPPSPYLNHPLHEFACRSLLQLPSRLFLLGPVSPSNSDTFCPPLPAFSFTSLVPDLLPPRRPLLTTSPRPSAGHASCLPCNPLTQLCPAPLDSPPRLCGSLFPLHLCLFSCFFPHVLFSASLFPSVFLLTRSPLRSRLPASSRSGRHGHTCRRRLPPHLSALTACQAKPHLPPPSDAHAAAITPAPACLPPRRAPPCPSPLLPPPPPTPIPPPLPPIFSSPSHSPARPLSVPPCPLRGAATALPPSLRHLFSPPPVLLASPQSSVGSAPFPPYPFYARAPPPPCPMPSPRCSRLAL